MLGLSAPLPAAGGYHGQRTGAGVRERGARQKEQEFTECGGCVTPQSEI